MTPNEPMRGPIFPARRLLRGRGTRRPENPGTPGAAEHARVPEDRAGNDHAPADDADAGEPFGFNAPIRKRDPVTRAALAVIRGYKLAVSPLMPPACRFVPTCSEYGYEAVAKYGIIKGGRLALWRILRCNPFGRGGYDPVP